MQLHFREQIRTGDDFDVDLPLHRETDSGVRGRQLMSAVGEISCEIGLAGETNNVDVLRALQWRWRWQVELG